jgi:hypothetical protein
MNDLLKELAYQLEMVENENIDKDDFINAVEEIYWEFKVNSKPNLKYK